MNPPNDLAFFTLSFKMHFELHFLEYFQWICNVLKVEGFLNTLDHTILPLESENNYSLWKLFYDTKMLYVIDTVFRVSRIKFS